MTAFESGATPPIAPAGSHYVESVDGGWVLEPNLPDDYLIWSHEHGAWWRPNRLGYTHDLARAGRYLAPEAREICERAAYRWLRGAVNPWGDVPPEVMVPLIPVLLAGPTELRSIIAEVTGAAVMARDEARGAGR